MFSVRFKAGRLGTAGLSRPYASGKGAVKLNRRPGRAIAFGIPRLLALADAPDHVEQEGVVALGAGELAADESLVGMHPGDVQSQPADHRQTGGGIALAVAHLVFVHRHVEHPVQAVLDRRSGRLQFGLELVLQSA